VKNKNLESNEFGSVRPYTRHTETCEFASDPEHNDCRCPKWLYTWNRETGAKSRKSLITPSWSDAVSKARKALRGMDPEIAAGRAVTEKTSKAKMTVRDACDLWIERSKRELGPESNSIAQYRTLKRKLCAWAERHGIEYIQDITSLQLEKWYSSPEWSELSPTTMSQRWGCVRSMFAFWQDRSVLSKSPAASIQRSKVENGQVQGPYDDSQVNKILASVDSSMSFNLPIHLRANYAPRLRAFIHLLLHTGSDVSDAVLFEPSRIETLKVGKKTVHVYRYKRLKTGVQAVILISSELAAEFRSIPLEPGTTKDLPFRTEGLTLKHDQQKWSKRVMAVLDTAGIDHVELPTRDKHGRLQTKDANVKQLRHTFAVRQLKAGQRAEEVARMLGHVDTSMVITHYAPWVKDLDKAHILRVMSVGQ
jgi:site-specific recombinase XerD